MTFPSGGPAFLFCPGDRPDRFDKALAAADVVILDLEDAVAPDHKDKARAEVAAAARRFGDRAVVRVNGVRTPWHSLDVQAMHRADVACLMVPKTSGPDDLSGLGAVDVIALCETAAGVVHADRIAESERCVGLFWGGEDLIADIGGRSSRDEEGRYRSVIEHARSQVLLAAASAGKAAIDAIEPDIHDLARVAVDARDAAGAGFRAKGCIHPSHVEVIRVAFAVTPTQLAWARGVLEAEQHSANGVFTYEGRMIDGPLIAQARIILQRADGAE